MDSCLHRDDKDRRAVIISGCAVGYYGYPKATNVGGILLEECGGVTAALKSFGVDTPE
ncbi:MAG: hypothetical protein GY801_04145 [bacterium]|nr:hypothetical protein [bacterium]